MRRGRKKRPAQTSLFQNEANIVPLEEWKQQARKSQRRKQPEQSLTNAVMQAARVMQLPCIHLEYFCGNSFFPKCTGTAHGRHAPAVATCPRCRRPVLAQCFNTINRNLAGHFDVLGIAWAIETKHKVNKGEQKAKLEKGQAVRAEQYRELEIPHLAMNEADDRALLNFLRERYREKYGKEPRI
jgi:hypothetical protein